MAVLTHWDGEPVGVWARVWRADRVEAHDVLGSTSDRLKELAAAGAGPFSVVVSDEQTAGRGRTGGAWHSPPGAGLWLSTLLPVHPAPAYLPLVVGVAAARAAEASCTGARVGLKWPNDLELEGRKVGGVLCEQSHGHVVAGIGINLRLPADGLPREVAERATALETARGVRVSVGALATALLHELHDLIRHPPPELPEAVHAELLRRDVLRDRRILSQQEGEGVARGIDRDGALWMERAGGARVRVVSGSVRTL